MTALSTALPATARRPRLPELNVLLGPIAICLVFEVLGWVSIGQSFLINLQRLRIIILQLSIIGIIAVGVTQVIISGGTDLSAGSVVGATAMITMSLAQFSTGAAPVYLSLTDLPVIVPLIAGLTVGALAGVINGSLVAYTKIPPFIATSGMLVTARGVAKWDTNGKRASFPTEAYATIGASLNPVILFAIVALLFHLALKDTVNGKHTYAIGSNVEAARIPGIEMEKHLVLVYAIAGLLAGLAAVVLSSKNLTAQSGMGVMYELDAVAMAVIGGVSLSRWARINHWHSAGGDDFRGDHFGVHVFAHRRVLSGNDQRRDHRLGGGGRWGASTQTRPGIRGWHERYHS